MADTTLPLQQRVLTMTAAFETGLKAPNCFATVAGNFDGQGISYGALQWNLGQNTLQPLLKYMQTNYEAQMKEAMGSTLYAELVKVLAKPLKDQMAWAMAIQKKVGTKTYDWQLNPEWREAFRKLGLTPGMAASQSAQAASRFKIALGACKEYGLTTERGVALMFDINVQNGVVDKNGAGKKIREDFAKLPKNLAPMALEVEKMKIIAKRRADVCSPQWISDVLERKMFIATGSGVVHKRTYNLSVDFGINLTKATELGV